MKNKAKKYGFLVIILIINAFVFIFDANVGMESLSFTGRNLLNFIFILTPVFICVGLLDVWVDREAMIKVMGDKSGIRGISIAFLLGVVTAVPLFALLPIAVMILKKGSRISNALVFVCSSASIRIPLLLFEVSSLGWAFMLVRFAVNFFLVIAIAFIIEKSLTKKDMEDIYTSIADK